MTKDSYKKWEGRIVGLFKKLSDIFTALVLLVNMALSVGVFSTLDKPWFGLNTPGDGFDLLAWVSLANAFILFKFLIGKMEREEKVKKDIAWERTFGKKHEVSK